MSEQIAETLMTVKRSEALLALSRDHHQALVVAQRLRRADDAGEAATTFLDFWRESGQRHFRIEEEVLLPNWALLGTVDEAAAARLSREHLAIRSAALAIAARAPDLEELGALGDRLAAHVRFEERVLFARIEADLGADDFGAPGDGRLGRRAGPLSETRLPLPGMRWALGPIVRGLRRSDPRVTSCDSRKEHLMPSGYVMHRTPAVRSAPRRPRLALRLRTWWHAPDLDAALANGTDPTGHDELRARAQQLASPKERAELATAIEHVVAIADRPPERLVSSPPLFRRDQVRANRSLLLQLAARLADQGPHALKGVAMTSVLLGGHRSPLHVKDGTGTLKDAVRATLWALDS